jgi:lipoprotein NlpD
MRAMIFSRRYSSIILIGMIFILSACATNSVVIPVSDKSQSIYHTVVPGDTLYAIAWRYDVDFRSLASVNHLKPPYVVRSGQRIYLNAKASPVASVASTQNKVNQAKQQQPNTAPAKAIPSAGAVKWRWPSTGKVVSRFDIPKGLNKGIDIEGKLGQPVIASATGTVVYAGSGLLGYGQLVILKHDEQFLSAYGHNNRLLVKENDQVVVGQKIAEMGSTGANSVKLHFEIRKEGKPIDPLNYLPPR